METFSEGVFFEEIGSEPLKIFEANQSGYKDGFVRFQPSGQVIHPRLTQNYGLYRNWTAPLE